jgi:L-ascorbate oxidase
MRVAWLDSHKYWTYDDLIVLPGNKLDANHPFHLHGHDFHVMAVEKLGKNTSREEVQNHVESGKWNKSNLLYAPLKDTVTVPDGGFSLLRFKATNPGTIKEHSNLCPYIFKF